jgi:hypothetical protein
MRNAKRKFALLPGSALLRVGYWQQAGAAELKGLIKRFATREHQARTSGKRSFVWRRRRLSAVAIYEMRFELAPEIFRQHKLSPLRSYYVREGRYIWPETGQPGKRIGESRKSRVPSA